MKLLTFYTNSHLEILNSYFLPSFKHFLQNDFELLESHYEQICITGEWATPRFGETMIGKLEHIVSNIDINDPNPLVYADCDIQFFANIKDDLLNEINDYDIKFQSDNPSFCAGFFICKQNQKMLNFFQDVLETLKASTKPNADDQGIINEFLTINKHPLKHGLLPIEKYYTVAYSTNNKVWNGEPFSVPKSILVHHANWTIGLQNKIKLLDYVKSNR